MIAVHTHSMTDWLTSHAIGEIVVSENLHFHLKYFMISGK